MNFQHPTSVREAVRYGYNLTEVANMLHTSQPSVSRQIRGLEEALGVSVSIFASVAVDEERALACAAMLEA